MKLYAHQEKTVEFLLADGPHKLLLDDCGVGKTAPTCVALTKIPHRHRQTLIVTLPSHKSTWMRELQTWANVSPDCINIINTGKDDLYAKRRGFVIISPQLLLTKRIQIELLKQKWDAIVVDEAHVYKSWDAVGSKFLYKHLLKTGNFIWFLTATLMPNRPIDLYLPLKCLFPEILGEYVDYEKFTRRYCAGHMDSTGWNANGSSHLSELRARLAPIMLGRELREVYPGLPPSITDEIYVDIDIEESERDTPTPTLERLVGIAKVDGAVDYLRDELYNEPTQKILVFTRNRQVTEEIYIGLLGFGTWRPLKYYGGMTKEEKCKVLKDFETDPLTRVLIANRTSLGQAYDGLQRVCNRIVEVQFDWQRGLQDQGYGRIVRNGQTKPVRITRIVAAGTVEDAIIRSYYQKKKSNDVLFANDKRRKIVNIEESLDRIAGALEILVSLKSEFKETSDSPKAKSTTKDGAKFAVSAVKKSAGKPVKSAPTEDEPEDEEAYEEASGEAEITEDDVRNVAGEVRAKLGGKSVPSSKAAIDKVTQSFKKKDGSKCKLLADIQAKDYAKVIEKLKALAPEESDGDEDEDEDED
jgi:SNF2 family DNA or RNA helicase